MTVKELMSLGLDARRAGKVLRNGEYWRERFNIIEAAKNKSGESVLAEVGRIFYEAQRELESQISVWYGRFAKNNEISLASAKRLLKTSELAELKWDVKEYIEYGRKNALNRKWMKELENASARFHVSRLEALKLQTRQTLEKVFANQFDAVDKLMKRQYLNGYYRTFFEIQKGFNIGWEIASINERTLEKILLKPWTHDGRTFSDNIWDNKNKLVSQVHNELTRNTILGKSPDEAINNITKAMNTSKHNAGRLIMTESAYFSNLAQKDAFDELGVERFEVVETLDSVTCSVCGAMDGKVFPMKDFRAGITAPPFHPWCRGCTVPYFDDDSGERAERNPKTGKTAYVDSKMKYNEWKRKFVDESKQSPDIGKSLDDDKNTYITPVGKNIDVLSVSDNLEANKNIFNTADNAGKTIIISRKNLENIYPELKEDEINYVMAAHKTVLEHGLKNGTEMFLAFDKSSGKIVSQKIGSRDEVKFKTSKLTKVAKDSIIFIHNHPSGSAFSPADFNALNALESIKYMGIQGHNGEMYSLSVGDGKRHEGDIGISVGKFMKDELKKYTDEINGIHEINNNIAEAFGWYYGRR